MEKQHLLLYSSYVIAALDLLSALLFCIVSFRLLIRSFHWTALVSILFTILWLGMVVVLLIGIWKRRVCYIRAWLVFTSVGILLDFLLLLYGIGMALSINFNSMKILALPFLGLAVEMTFVHIIYLMYTDLTGAPMKRRCFCCRSRKNKKKKKSKKRKSSKKRSKK